MQKTNKEVLGKWDKNLENNTRDAETSAALLDEKNVHCESALEEYNLQWTGVNKLLSAYYTIRLDEIDILENKIIPYFVNIRNFCLQQKISIAY